MTKIRKLLESVQELLERRTGTPPSRQGWNKPSGGKKHNPFKYRDRLDNGPMQNIKKKKDEWKCKCSNYKCVCHGKGGKIKNIKQNPNYKMSYQRRWLDKLQGRRTASSIRKSNPGGKSGGSNSKG